MAVVEAFLRESSLEQLNKLQKDNVLEIRKHLELDVRKLMIKASLVKVIAEHMVNNDIFEDEILNQLLVDVQEMSQAQFELEKAKIDVRTELEKACIEVEKASIEQEIRFKELEIGRQDSEVRQQGFDLTKQIRLKPKFQEDQLDNYFSHFKKTAMNSNWPRSAWPMLLQS